RRFVHYDYQQARLRGSILTDAKADLLVYGMGERAILTIAERLAANRSLAGIPSTCERLTEKEFQQRVQNEAPLVLPSWQEIAGNPAAFMAAELAIDEQARSLSDRPLCQKQQAMYVWQNTPAPVLQAEELDRLYSLPFRRRPHPDAGEVPAWRMVRDSVTIVRGCSGNCAFCAITRHQGALVISRSPESIVAEVEEIAGSEDFRGTISDLGGPTANLYGTSCRVRECRRHDCFFPELCKNLQVDERHFLALLDRCEKVAGVKHLHISSGLRMELLLKAPELLKRLIEKHLPGAMKIAPEHTEDEVLRLMHKPGGKLLKEFLNLCRKLAGARPPRFVPYFIASHPGCTEQHMKNLAAKVKELGLEVRKFQDFTPTPGTISTAMYVTGLDREGCKIAVARGTTARRKQRKVLEDITIRAKRKSAPKKDLKKPAGKNPGRRKR
ncbi:MAG: radical SAM protein, partial [Desulfurivibrionaceae bacterium]|nr:radical SAM protein [Desulfurivibrionaceae bacterium]